MSPPNCGKKAAGAPWTIGDIGKKEGDGKK